MDGRGVVEPVAEQSDTTVLLLREERRSSSK